MTREKTDLAAAEKHEPLKPKNCKTLEEITAYLDELATMQHDYNTSAEALMCATVATFNCMAGVLGNTGFQAGWAAISAYGEIERIDGPFGIVRGESMLYPQQSSPTEKAAEFEEKWAEWAADEARKKLEEHPEVVYEEHTFEDGKTMAFPNVHPDVHAHWAKLAATQDTTP